MGLESIVQCYPLDSRRVPFLGVWERYPTCWIFVARGAQRLVQGATSASAVAMFMAFEESRSCRCDGGRAEESAA